MSASTRTIQQPASTGSLGTALAMGVIALAAALSISWGATNFVGKANVAQPVQAGVVDEGSAFKRGNPLGAVAGNAADEGSAFKRGNPLGAASTQTGGSHGAPGAYRPVDSSNGGRGTRLAQ